MSTRKKSVLVIGAHIDDCECGECGGISLKFAKLGYEVFFLNTIGNLRGWSIARNKKDEKILLKEAHVAAGILGARKILLDYQNNCFYETDFRAVSDIAKVVGKVNPEIVLVLWPKDNHPDHVRTAKASLEALSYFNRFAGRKPAKVRLQEILAYEASSWQTEDFKPDFFINITEEMETVCRSMEAFKHLGEAVEYYIKEKKTKCASWGVQSGFKYAEGFKHLGPQFPLRSSLPDLFGQDLQPTGSYQYPWGSQYFI